MTKSDNTSVVVVDVFKDIANRVSAKLGIQLNYMHGHPLEITNTLSEMTRSSDTTAMKYPLLALFQDFPEKSGGAYVELELDFILAILTEQNLKAPERYEVSFKPFLYPLYDCLMKQIARSGYFAETDERGIKRVKYDRLYWGRNGLYGNTGNIFNDRLDAIEIQRMILKLKPLKC